MLVRASRSALVVLATVAECAFIPAGASSNAACPLSTLNCERIITSTDSVKSCDGCVNACSSASYDLIHGTFQVVGYGFDVSSSAGLDAVDEYRIIGPPPGTPLTFTAEMAVFMNLDGYCTGYGYCTASRASASLREGDSNLAAMSVETPLNFDEINLRCCAKSTSAAQTLRVTIVRTVGEVFTLHYGMSCSQQWSSGYVVGQMRFSGLPGGASVVSCQGYRQDFATVSRPMSWGQVKLRYR